ncbi:MAG: hypothetical protein IJJ22_05760 [Oscillospiraceae bacterium]|nr:hypothetical protein [Oscillospiraceae bacterium]
MKEEYVPFTFSRIVRPEDLPEYLQMHRDEFITVRHPFAEYMRAKFREKGVLQQNVFLAADLSENYGYKLIAEEKHTVDRDVILRICLAARFDISETQEALILYGMAPLDIRLPRDHAVASAMVYGITDHEKINELLVKCGQRPMTKNTD